MCPHFGLLEDEGESKLSHLKRKTKDAEPRVLCRACGLSASLFAEASVRPAVRHFLRQSLPFAACPKPDCPNSDANVFEHWGTAYRGESAHKARCLKCGARFALGVPAPPSAGKRKETRKVCREVALTRGVTDTLESMDGRLSAGAYYRRLRRGGEAMRDCLAYRNARLLRGGLAQRDGPLRLFTDVMQASLRRGGVHARFQNMNVVVTVVRLEEEKTFFVLAAHPCFVGSDFVESDARRLLEDERAPVRERRWHWTAHRHRLEPPRKGRSLRDRIPDASRDGLFIPSPYGELAHFLVVRKLVRRFPLVHLTMDASKSLWQSALTAFAGPIRGNAVEIALFQHEKDASGRAGGGRRTSAYKADEETLAQAFEDVETAFAGRLRDLASKGRAHPNQRAKVFRLAFQGGYSKNGGWAWLEFPQGHPAYRNCRTLWLTRRPDQRLEDSRELLLKSPLGAVDSAIASMRRRVRSLGRPAFRAKPGRSYAESYVDPAAVIHELWVYLLLRNYSLRQVTAQKIPPAKALGLLRRHAQDKRRNKEINAAVGFRLGAEHAERMTRWLAE